jgi:hypothetical protein
MLTRSSYILRMTAISKGKQQYHMQQEEELSEIYCNSSKWNNVQTKKYGNGFRLLSVVTDKYSKTSNIICTENQTESFICSISLSINKFWSI